MGAEFATEPGKIYVPPMLNGALAGLVSVTAEPSMPSVSGSLAIGSVGALVMMIAAHVLECTHLDDAVGEIPVHLAAGTLRLSSAANLVS
ncbi:hypothetical protein J7394_19650 [Ruegeria sp. R13_0]|uniref:hypothetical protein n=1 Tax=Ruegeria sp. R13_0 TaxID=2821099 RepID=UPI001ADA1352|nr:hypothetical protein [Ruegeria sp. R13_0]